MKMRLLAAATVSGLLGLTACGGTETVYIVSETAPASETKAPETTVARTTTTRPVETRPPANVPSYSGDYDPEMYDDFLWTSVNDFWWLFSKDQLLTMGLLVCEAFDSGATLDDVTNELLSAMANTSTIYLMEGLAAVTAGAVTFLCPEHAWWLNTI